MMAWLVRFLMFVFVAVAAAGGWFASSGVASALSLDIPSSADRAPYRVVVSGNSLESRVVQALAVVNTERSARREHGQAHVLILEKVSFERSAGGVVARGSVKDLGGPRSVNAVVDAFDAQRGYIASGSSKVTTTDGSTPFSVFLTDDDRFESFAVRFLNDGMEEMVTRTTDSASTKTRPLLVDDALLPADIPELAARLAELGYVDQVAEIKDDVIALAVVQRFRKDHAIAGPQVVTVGDLLALREVAPAAPLRIDMAAY